MTEPHRPRVKYVIGPDGSPLTIADLPPPTTKRWVIRRKAEVVAAVRGGLLSLEEACARYTLTVEEFLSQFRLRDAGSSQPAFSFGRPHRENRILFAAPWIRPRFINRTLTINWANLAG
jgi:hypothetical protein